MRVVPLLDLEALGGARGARVCSLSLGLRTPLTAPVVGNGEQE